MAKFVPCLGPEGWIPQGQKMLNQLSAHMYCSDFSQSNLFFGLVSSVAYQVKTHQGNIDQAVRALRDMITEYFARYFNRVEVEIYVIENDAILRGEIAMSAVVEDAQEQTYQLNEAMTSKGSVARHVLDYLDEGVLP